MTGGTAFQMSLCVCAIIMLTTVSGFSHGFKQYKRSHDKANIRLTSAHLNSKEDLIASITGVSSVVLQAFPLFRNGIVDLLTSLPDIQPKFSDSVGLDSNYVTHPLLEEKIERVSKEVISEKRGEYTIIVGPT